MSLRVVRRHGSRIYYLRGTVRGIVVDKSTKTDNRDAAEAIRIKEEQLLLDRSVFGAKATVTFLEAAVAYMEKGGEARFMQPLLEHFKTRKLSEIGQGEIDGAAAALYPGRANSTINRQVYTPMSAVLAFAATREWTEHRKWERPEQVKGRVRWLTHDEASRLVECCSPHMAPLVTFLLLTGARLSEALYLQWREVDLQRAHVTFLQTKSGIDRGVPLHPRAVAELANLKHRMGAVFRRPDGRPYAEKGDGGGQIKTGFSAACRRSGIEDFSPHDCRHTWATWHYAANRDLTALMALGGWKSVEMVVRYAHVNVGHLAPSINSLGW